MLKNLIDTEFQSDESIVQADSSDAVIITGCQVIAVQVDAVVSTPSAQVVPSASIDAGTDTFTKANHGFLTGLKIQISTSSALPAPLAGSTDYFVIKVTDNTFKLASSLVNANAGTPINLSDAGTGNQTVTPVALAGATAKLQKSMDGVNWYDEGSSQNITTTASLYFEKVDPSGKYYKVLYAITAGQVTASASMLGKGLDG